MPDNDFDATNGAVVQWDFSGGGGTQAKLVMTPGDNAGTLGQVLTSAGPGGLPDFEDAPSPPTATADFQRFNSSSTWNKPSGYSANSRVLIRAWGGGGSGSQGSAEEGGGGGGGYSECWKLLSELGATETVTIGAGGAAVASAGNNGNTGGNTTFGSHLTAYGGGGGTNAAPGTGGGGGGPLGAASLGTPGAPLIANSATPTFHGGPGQAGIWHGGGGGTSNQAGGASVFGGGGGGGESGSAAAAGGTSVNGGNGGAGGVNGAAGTAGSQPGGGGGASESGGASGAGGAGRVDVFVFAST